MKKSVLLAVLAVAGSSLCANALFFNSDKALADSKAGKSLQKLQFKIQNELQQVASSKQSELERKARDLQSQVQNQLLSDAEIAAEQSKLGVEQRQAELELEQLKLKKGSELMDQERKLKTDLASLVKSEASKRDCSLVDTKALSSSGLFVINDKDDVTASLVAALDKKADAQAALSALEPKKKTSSDQKTV